jgi:hypothetical protein
MATKLTILQFTDRLEKIATPRQLNKAILPPFRKGLKVMQQALAAEYWSNVFGRRIWEWQRDAKGDRKAGPSLKLGTRKRRRYARWSQSEGAYIGKIHILGLAAKMELGGRLRRHVPYGREERAYSPGLHVPMSPKYASVVENKLWDRTVDDISDSFGKFVERTL